MDLDAYIIDPILQLCADFYMIRYPLFQRIQSCSTMFFSNSARALLASPFLFLLFILAPISLQFRITLDKRSEQ